MSQTATGQIEWGGLTICDLAVELDATETATSVRFVASLANATGAPIRVTLPDGCAGAPVQLEGLPPGYDAYQTCNRAACDAAGSSTVTVEVPARSKIPIAQLEVAPRSSCQAPLADDLLYVSGVIPASAAPQLEVCPSSQVMLGIVGGKIGIR